MSPVLVSPGVRKEVRALLPTWLASVAAVFLAALVPEAAYSRLPSFAFAIGMLALGAQSVGHEYTHRTLGTLLSLPSDRRRLLLKKFAVLLIMLLMLSALAWFVLLKDPALAVKAGIDSRVLIGAAVAAFFLAPWLTMVCRSSLAGIVFSITIPALLLIAGDLIGLAIYGLGGGALIDDFKFAFLWRSLFVVCAVAAVSTWRMFSRLEAVDGPSADVEAPEWLLRDASDTRVRLRREHPYWLLAKKELRLQQMTFVVVAIFSVGWAALTLLARLTEHLPLIPVDAIAVLYFAILTILIGSLASAEERHMGTLEWQTLLPIASSRQWLIKIAIVFGLVGGLGILLPVIVMGMSQRPRDVLSLGGFIFIVTTISVYVSSVSTSGVKAMVATLPTTFGLIIVFNLLVYTAYRAGWGRISYSLALRPVLGTAVFAGFIALALRFAYMNHRSADRSVRRVLMQTASLAAYLIVLLGALGLMERSG